MIERIIESFLIEALYKWNKMAFLSGPRQVGKTTLSQKMLENIGQGVYFNWDVITDQKKLANDPYFFEKISRDMQRPFLTILDEIHKYAKWKNYLKGAYDKHKNEFEFLITGSGRLDLFKKGGDSLLGRYIGVPLFPLTVGEILKNKPSVADFKSFLSDLPPAMPEAAEAYVQLFSFSGFPEPFINAEEKFYRIWFEERNALIVKEDIRDAVNIREISLMEMLTRLIPERIGSPLSINSLREDIGVAFETARDWVELLSRFYYLFKISPFSSSIKRALKKGSKVYLYDWVEVTDGSLRFENIVALHLLKAVKTWKATGDVPLELNYLRDKEKREVDFVILENKKPLCLIECKYSSEDAWPALSYYQQKLKVPYAVQVVHKKGVLKKLTNDVGVLWIISASQFLKVLG